MGGTLKCLIHTHAQQYIPAERHSRTEDTAGWRTQQDGGQHSTGRRTAQYRAVNVHLSSLEDKFTDYTLDKITPLWDIQLTTVSATIVVLNQLVYCHYVVARGGAIGSS